MEKVAFIVDGGFFVKKYKTNHKKFPEADDVETYILQIFKYLKKNYDHPIEIYRIFYYDCPPLHNLAEQVKKPDSMKTNDFKKICEAFEKSYKAIKKFHDKMKRKSFFALRMGQLRLQGWEQKENLNYWSLKIKQKGVDMRIGLDIANITAKKLCSKVVLISGDTDMIPAMKTARKEGVHVYWHSMDDGKCGSNLDLATHSDVIITNKLLKSIK